MLTCGVILAGGKSSRMGTDKSLLQINDNNPIIQDIHEELKQINEDTVIVTNHPDQYNFMQAAMIGDRYFDMGPLAGLETAMYHIDAECYIVAACDMPFINNEVYTHLKQQLQSYDAVVPIFNDQLHPLAGVYRRKVLPYIQQQLQSQDLRVKGFFKNINVSYVEDFSSFSKETIEKHFFNMNNPSEFEHAKRL